MNTGHSTSGAAAGWRTLFLRNRYLLVISIVVSLAAGLFAFKQLKRAEDPRITNLYPIVITPFPGASAARVETLVTEPLEDQLAEVEAIKETTSGRIGKLLRRERNYFLRNAKADRLNYAKAQAAKLPIGSGSIESGVRRVINLRLKGASIYWLEESANSMLLLRSFYKAGRWKLLEKLALTSELQTAA